MDRRTWIAELRTFAVRARQRDPIPDRSSLSAEDDQQRRIIGSDFYHWGWNDEAGLNRIQGQRRIFGGAEDIPTIMFSTNWPGLVAARELLPADPPNPVICLLQSEFAEFNQLMLQQEASRPQRWHTELENLDQELLDQIVDGRTHLDVIRGEPDRARFDYAEFCVHRWSYFAHPIQDEPQPDTGDDDFDEDELEADDDDSGDDPGGIEGWPRTSLGAAQQAYPAMNPQDFRVHVVGDLWGTRAGSSCEHLWRWDGHKLELLQENFGFAIY